LNRNCGRPPRDIRIKFISLPQSNEKNPGRWTFHRISEARFAGFTSK
jgi:hypothetical protein